MSFENILPIICFFAPIVLGILLWYERFQHQKIKENIQRRDREERWIQEQQRKFKCEKAAEAYETIKKAGCEDILKALDGYNYDEVIDTLCEIGSYIGALGISTKDASNAFNALATPSEETTETQEQKEPQVIFEPKVMIIEPEGQKPIKIAGENIISIKQDDEINSIDDWYERFMEEVKLG